MSNEQATVLDQAATAIRSAIKLIPFGVVYAELTEALARIDSARRMEGTDVIPDRPDAKHWVINHNADTTETGLPMNRSYVRTLWNGHDAHETTGLMLRDWCYERFGAETDYVQGVAPTASWSIHESTREQWEQASPIKWGGYPTETRRLVLTLGCKSTLDRRPMIEILYDESTKADEP